MHRDVLHLLGSAQRDGTAVARLVRGLAEGLEGRRYRLHSWFLREDGPLRHELQDAGLPTEFIDWSRGLHDPAGLCRFWRILRARRFALVHQHFGGRSVRWAIRRAGHARIVVHMHGASLEERGLHAVTSRARNVDAVVAVSEAVARHAEARTIRVIYPAVATPDEAAGDERRTGKNVVIGMAGRLAPIKGGVDAIRAILALRSEFPGLRLEVAGDGPERSSLEREVQRSGLGGTVNFLGWITDVRATMRNWDIFLHPSLSEGFPLAVLEAMASGLPVVATAVGGIPELVEDGRTGCLVPPANPVALAHAIRKLLRDPDMARAMGMFGRARARRCFPLRRMVEAVGDMYDELLSRRVNGEPTT